MARFKPTLIDLNQILEKVVPNRLERVGWLVDRLYHEINENEEEA